MIFWFLYYVHFYIKKAIDTYFKNSAVSRCIRYCSFERKEIQIYCKKKEIENLFINSFNEFDKSFKIWLYIKPFFFCNSLTDTTNSCLSFTNGFVKETQNWKKNASFVYVYAYTSSILRSMSCRLKYVPTFTL